MIHEPLDVLRRHIRAVRRLSVELKLFAIRQELEEQGIHDVAEHIDASAKSVRANVCFGEHEFRAESQSRCA